MNSKATADQLGELHGLLAENMKQQLDAYQKSGEEIPPAFLAQVIRFLKDNGIDQPLQPGNPIDQLASRLPKLAEVDEYGLPN